MATYKIKKCMYHGRTKYTLEGRGYFRCIKCRVKAVSDRRIKIKALLVSEAGSKCTRCGYNRHIGALDFHHLNPKTKLFGLATGGITRSLSAARKEAAKCILLCANCHREIEAGL